MYRFIFSAVFMACLATACTPVHRLPEESFRDFSGPTVLVDGLKLSRTREGACEHIADSEVRDAAAGASAAGMLKQDLDVIREVSKKHQVIVTFRDSNQACLPHLAAGVQSKPHAVLQKTWDSGNLLSKDEHLAGLVSDRMKKPAKGEKIPDPQLTLYNGEPVTCDYDLMDMAENSGERIPGETAREREVRDAFNRAIPQTVRGHRDRVMHGSQAGYREYSMLHRDEPVITGLLRPEAPVTAFTPSGTIFRLQSMESVLNFYRCYRIPLPAEWHVEVENRSVVPPSRTRLQNLE